MITNTNNVTFEVYKRWVSELEKFSIERKKFKTIRDKYSMTFSGFRRYLLSKDSGLFKNFSEEVGYNSTELNNLIKENFK